MVRLDFWYSAGENEAYKFFEEIEGITNLYKMNFVPHLVTWISSVAKKQRYNYIDDPDCISGGRYCAPDPGKHLLFV